MTLAPGATWSPDEAITADREETKYLVPPERLDALMAELPRRLPAHRFQGEGANRLPDPHHFVTTIYFDTASRAYLREAESDFEHSLKVRAKEYYDLHPSLAELATDPTELVRYQPWLWFELKRRDGTHVSKRRFRLRKSEVQTFFVEGRVTPDAFALPEASNRGTGSPGTDQGLREILEHCRRLDEPLSASALVNYRRLSWQASDGGLRVTIDLGLAYYAPPPDLWSRDRALVRTSLGPAVGREARAVLEVKHHAALPQWLASALAGTGVRPMPFSKFVEASRAAVRHG